MRARRRYRPGHDFRPLAEVLLPRIAPSDITVMMLTGTDAGTTTTEDPGAAPDCPIYTGPDDGGGSDPRTRPPSARRCRPAS